MYLTVETKLRRPDNVLAMVSVEEVPQDDNPDSTRKISLVEWSRKYWRAILAEFVSTAFLLLFGCMSCLPLEGFNVLPPLYAPFGFGLVVLINIQTFGHISGAHMNPTVTLSAVIWGITPPGLGIVYVIVQCAGATLGYGLLYSLVPTDITTTAVCATQVKGGLGVYQAIVIEALLTSMLILICLASWDSANEKKQDSLALKLGLTITGLSIVGASLTGCSMNPARTFGPTVWIGNWSMHYVYWVGPFLGSLISSIIYKTIWATKAESSGQRREA